MAIITPAGNLSDRVVDITADQTGGSGGVPQSRRIDTVAPLAGGGDLSADRILSISLTPTSTLAVGASRLINAVSPILVNGAPSADLTTDITISQNAFDGNNPGYVIPNLSGPTGNAYLSDTGAWTSSTVSGVPSNRTLHMVPPLTIDGLSSGDLSADRTIDAGVFTSAQKGFVPGSGGGDPTKFLSADGTFKAPTFGSGFVTLQATTPGTADNGNAHITGTLIAETELVAGSNKKSLNGVGNETFYVKQTSGAAPVIGRYVNGGPPTAGLIFRSGRGTEVAPTAPNTTDQIAALTIETIYTPGVYDNRDFIRVSKRQSNGPNHVPFDVDIQASQGASTDPQLSIRLGSNGLGGVGNANTISPMSGFEVATTFGLTPKVLTAGGTYTVVEATDPSVFLIDCTTATTTVNLPPANGRFGRVYFFAKVDETPYNFATISNTFGNTIGAASSWALYSKGDCLGIVSDNNNWWIISYRIQDQFITAADGTTVANTTTETTAIAFSGTAFNNNIIAGQVYKANAAGKLSTTSNPTLRFRIYNSGANVLADSGIIEMPDTVTNTAWKVDFVSTQSSASPPTGRVLDATLKVAAADGVFTEWSMFSTFGNPTNGAIPAYMTVQWGTADAANTLTTTASNSQIIPKVSVQ